MTSHLMAQFTPVALMMSIIAMNHLIANQRADRKTAAEATRLRAALAAELRTLLELYRQNLQLIEQKADYILSSRSSVFVYRNNLARITMLLDPALIEQIVGVYGQNERIEGIMSARSNFKCGLTYQFSSADAKFEEWKHMFEQAAADILSVSRLFEDQNCSVIATKTSVHPSQAFDRLVQPESLQAATTAA